MRLAGLGTALGSTSLTMFVQEHSKDIGDSPTIIEQASSTWRSILAVNTEARISPRRSLHLVVSRVRGTV